MLGVRSREVRKVVVSEVRQKSQRRHVIAVEIMSAAEVRCHTENLGNK